MEHGRYVEAKPKGKDGFKFRARNELTTKRKSRKRNAERCRFGEPHELMTREARENDFSVLRPSRIIIPFLRVKTWRFSFRASRRFFRRHLSHARFCPVLLHASRFLVHLPFKPRSTTYLANFYILLPSYLLLNRSIRSMILLIRFAEISRVLSPFTYFYEAC